MGVTGDSSVSVAEHLKGSFFCIMSTSTVYCAGQRYVSKVDEVRQVADFLRKNGVERLALVVASSIAAGKALRYGNLRRQLADSLEDKPFLPLPEELQRHIYFEFGSVEEHYKYRDAVRRAYPHGNYPVFEGYNHMQHQIRDPEGFAEMLRTIMKESRLPELAFLKE